MTKEVLTKENIVKDVRAYVGQNVYFVRSDFRELTIYATISAIGTIWQRIWVLAVPLCMIAVVCILRHIYLWSVERKEYKVMANGEFTVLKEKLSHIGKETIHESGARGTATEANFLYFSCGQWRIMPQNYTWSKTFSMSGRGVDNTSLVGDEFYVVILHSTQEICAVYNTKFFIYEE